VREDANAAYAGSVPFLMLTGNLAAGWQLARAMLAATEARAGGDASDFINRKIATAAFYAHNVLPECAAERAKVIGGAPSLLAAEL
jgi:hypothetical protein